MTYFDATLDAEPVSEQNNDPILPEERFVFELIGFERSQPDQWHKNGGIKWSFLVFQEDGRTPFIFNDEQYVLWRTTNVSKEGKPLFTIGTQAHDWAQALLGRNLGPDDHFSVSELRNRRMSSMVVWQPKKTKPKEKAATLASLRHIPVGAGPSPASSRAQDEASAAADKAINDMEREAILRDLATALKTAKKFGVPATVIQTFQDAFDESESASVAQLQEVLNSLNKANQQALDD